MTVVHSQDLCTWATRCNADNMTLTKCGARTGSVSSVARSVALVFYGKAGGFDLRPLNMRDTDQASLELLRASHKSWSKHLLSANPETHFAVFAHSWSPEIKEPFAKLWGSRLVRAQHDSTWMHGGKLSFACVVDNRVCPRTASMLLGIAKALVLKQEDELRSGRVFPLVIVTRHDLSLIDFWHLPNLLWRAADPDDVWFPTSCNTQCHGDVVGALPAGCHLKGRHCETNPEKSFVRPPWELQTDWMFACSSSACDRMGDAFRHFHSYSRLLYNRSGCTPTDSKCFEVAELAGRGDTMATHSLWPMHATQIGLNIRFDGLIADNAITLTRQPKGHTCYRNATPAQMAVTLGHPRRARASLRDSPLMYKGMHGQCPHNLVLLCGECSNTTLPN